MSNDTFNRGDVVFSQDWGPGLIREIADNTLLIDFLKKPGHRMSGDLASRALLKGTAEGYFASWLKDPSRLHSMARDKDPELVALCLRDASDGLPISTLRTRLEPFLPEQVPWSKWWSAIQRRLKKSNSVVGPLGNEKRYSLQAMGPNKSTSALEGFWKSSDFHSRYREALRYLRALKPLRNETTSDRATLELIRDYFSNRLQQFPSDRRVLALAILARLSQFLGPNVVEQSDEPLPELGQVFGAFTDDDEREEVLKLYLTSPNKNNLERIARLLLIPNLTRSVSRRILASILVHLGPVKSIELLEELIANRQVASKLPCSASALSLLDRLSDMFATSPPSTDFPSQLLLAFVGRLTALAEPIDDPVPYLNALIALGSSFNAPTEQIVLLLRKVIDSSTSASSLAPLQDTLSHHRTLYEELNKSIRLDLEGRIRRGILEEPYTSHLFSKYRTLVGDSEALDHLFTILEQGGPTLSDSTINWLFTRVQELDGLEQWIRHARDNVVKTPDARVLTRLIKLSLGHQFPREQLIAFLDAIYFAQSETVSTALQPIRVFLEPLVHAPQLTQVLLDRLSDYSNDRKTLLQKIEKLECQITDEADIRRRAESYIDREVRDRLRVTEEMQELQFQAQIRLMAEIVSQLGIFEGHFLSTIDGLLARRVLSESEQTRGEALKAQLELIKKRLAELANAHGLKTFGQEGQVDKFDPSLHELIGNVQITTGALVKYLTFGLEREAKSHRIIVRRALVSPA